MHAAQWMLLTLAIAVAGTAGAQAQYLKKEPAMGAMKPGERVLVDDGRCPKGAASTTRSTCPTTSPTTWT